MEKLVYYISKLMKGLELRYSRVEKGISILGIFCVKI